MFLSHHFSNKLVKSFLIFSCFLFIFLSCPANASTDDNIKLFRSGLFKYNTKDYEGAIEIFRITKLPLLNDYILLFLSKSYMYSGNPEQSLTMLDQILNQYPGSSLYKEALRLKIENSMKGNWDTALELFPPYVSKYADDYEMKFLFAQLLWRRGHREKATLIFKEIYLAAGELSSDAEAYISIDDFSVSDLLSRANHLIDNSNFAEAENTLVLALNHSKSENETSVLEKLGFVLFIQRKYNDAASTLMKADNLFLAAKAFLRSGNHRSFEMVIEEMESRMDDEVVELQVANAIEKQSNAKTEEAIELIEKTIHNFPSNNEMARWQLGWIYYKIGNFNKASDIFKDLYESFKENKYLYWYARSKERTGFDSSELYIMLKEPDFYGFLAQSRLYDLGKPNNIKIKSDKLKKITSRRVELLLLVGLREKALAELEFMSSNAIGTKRLIGIALKLIDIQEYNLAIRLLDRLPEKKRPLDILYPLAYWQNVSSITSEYGIDPFLFLSIMREESLFDPGVVSKAGAIGLMQLMPQTARKLALNTNIVIETNEVIYDISTNIRLGAYYMSNLISDFQSIPPAIAAYNAGENKVRQWINIRKYESSDEFIEDIPYKETRNYVKRIITTYHRYRMLKDSIGNGSHVIL